MPAHLPLDRPTLCVRRHSSTEIMHFVSECLKIRYIFLFFFLSFFLCISDSGNNGQLLLLTGRCNQYTKFLHKECASHSSDQRPWTGSQLLYQLNQFTNINEILVVIRFFIPNDIYKHPV